MVLFPWIFLAEKVVYCAVFFYLLYEIEYNLLVDSWDLDLTMTYEHSYSSVDCWGWVWGTSVDNPVLYITYSCKFSHSSCNAAFCAEWCTFRCTVTSKPQHPNLKCWRDDLAFNIILLCLSDTCKVGSLLFFGLLSEGLSRLSVF